MHTPPGSAENTVIPVLPGGSRKGKMPKVSVTELIPSIFRRETGGIM